MSFLEEAGDEGVPRYEGSPSSSIAPSTSSGTRPPSLLSRTPSEKSRTYSNQYRTMQHSAPKVVEVDAWRRKQQQQQRQQTDGTNETPISQQLSEQLSGLLNIDEEATPVRLEKMTDAEIAQHHFRLAQQHLQAAQRLALAAASAPPALSSTTSTAPSSAASSTSHARRPQLRQKSISHHSRDESRHDDMMSASTVSRYGPPRAAGAATYANRARGPQFFGDSYGTVTEGLSSSPSGDSTLSYSPSAPPEAGLAPVAPVVPPRFESSPSSFSVRSAPSFGNLSAPESMQRPVPPPRRATVSSTVPKGGHQLGSTSSLPPSLYGGSLPVGVPDRVGPSPASETRADAANVTTGHRREESSSYEREIASVLEQAATFPSHAATADTPDANQHPLAAEEAEEQDWDDSRSDFYGSESVFSHVTRATLPEYEDALASGTAEMMMMSPAAPPVPTIPSRFLTPTRPAIPAYTSLTAASFTTPSRSEVEQEEDFRGFRPRQTTASYTQPSAPTPQALLPQTAPRPAHAHSAAPFSNLQPHAYVLSPSGQPIPVYSSAAFRPAASAPPPPQQPSAPPVAPAARSNTLPVHAQPLRFEHTVPYSAPFVNSTVEVSYANRSMPGPTPSLTSRPSANALSRQYLAEPISRPQSAWSDTSSVADDTRSIAAGSTLSRTKNRMASLRAKVPHVRFMSPDPTVLRAPRGGNGSARQAPKTGVRRSGSVMGGSAGSQPQPGVIPEQEGESEDERDKRQRAMQMSLGMLI
ncbi:hypothetical protein JCM10908_002405 [Rhodotorula pacifica]|uniref:uncharacterized protein n=1 Tax=Rhodotorula pacifica TaxID=1495444 RepID=UPI00316E0F33